MHRAPARMDTQTRRAGVLDPMECAHHKLGIGGRGLFAGIQESGDVK
jgi:hypothetical protein